MFHLMAYHDLNFASTSYTTVTPLLDGVLGYNRKDRYVYGRDLRLFASQVFSDNLEGARISTPSMSGVGTVMVRPWIDAVVAQNDPNLAVYLDRPPLLKKGEEINLEAKVSSSSNIYGFNWVTEGLQLAPPGEIITLDVETDILANQYQWTEVLPNWSDIYSSDILPNGTYAVVGSEHVSDTALAHRWIFDNQNFRPGGLSQTALDSRTHRLFYDGVLGVWGTFSNQVPPRLEVFCTGDSDNSHRAFLQVVRISD